MPILDCGDLIEKETVHILTIDSVAYDPEEKMTPKTYQTWYVYAMVPSLGRFMALATSHTIAVQGRKEYQFSRGK